MKRLILDGVLVISNPETLNLSPFMVIYNMLVAKDNQLRQINVLVDHSFVYEEMKNK